jgi:hypothetical protein
MEHTWSGVEKEFEKLRADGVEHKGVKGDKGETGLTGPQGPAGVRGPTGPKGDVPDIAAAVQAEVSRQLQILGVTPQALAAASSSNEAQS